MKGFAIVLLLLVGALLVIGYRMAEPQPGEQATSELNLSASDASALTAAISGRGFNCPAAKMAFGRGVDAYGTVMRVHCGPADQEGVYEKAVFRVTSRPDGSLMISPWAD